MLSPARFATRVALPGDVLNDRSVHPPIHHMVERCLGIGGASQGEETLDIAGLLQSALPLEIEAAVKPILLGERYGLPFQPAKARDLLVSADHHVSMQRAVLVHRQHER